MCTAGGTFGRHVLGSGIHLGTGGTLSISVDPADVPSPKDGGSSSNPGHHSTAVLAGETWCWLCSYLAPSTGAGASNFSEVIGITFQ